MSTQETYNTKPDETYDFESILLGIDCFSETPPPEYADGKYTDPVVQAKYEAFQAGVLHARYEEGEKHARRLQEIDNETYDFDVSCEDEAKRRGATVVYPEPNQLQIDLDGPDAVAEFYRRLDYWNFKSALAGSGPEIKAPYKIEEVPSRKPGHVHITITVNGASYWDLERIAIQAALGSDTVREYLNLMRYYEGIAKPTRLFKYPEPEILRNAQVEILNP